MFYIPVSTVSIILINITIITSAVGITGLGSSTVVGP